MNIEKKNIEDENYVVKKWTSHWSGRVGDAPDALASMVGVQDDVEASGGERAMKYECVIQFHCRDFMIGDHKISTGGSIGWVGGP